MKEKAKEKGENTNHWRLSSISPIAEQVSPTLGISFLRRNIRFPSVI